MAATQYLDLTGLKAYNKGIKKYIDEHDISIVKAAAADTTANMAATYIVKSVDVTYEADGVTPIRTEKELSRIDIPFGKTIVDANLITEAATTEGGKAQTYLDLEIGLVKGAEGNEHVKANVTVLTDRLDTLEADVDTEGSVKNTVYTEAADAKYGTTTIYKKKDDPDTAISAVAYEVLSADDQALYESATEVITIKDAIDAAANSANVEIKKLSSADEGAFATYGLYNGEALLGTKINIPKDFLIKSGSIKTLAEGETAEGVAVGEKYLDFVVNSKDAEDETGAEHIVIPVKDLVDVYTAKADAAVIQVSIDENNEISASIIDASISRAKIDADFEEDIADIEALVAGEYKIGKFGESWDGASDVTIKEYIDSRIFIGTAEEIAAAKTAKTIDDTTFTIEVDEGADAFEPIDDETISGLFD